MFKKPLLKKRPELSTFAKFYLLILLPVICMMTFSAICVFSYYNNYKALLEESYFTKLESVYQENEISLQSIAKYISLLSNNQLFMDIVSDKTEDLSYDETSSINKLLKQVQKNNPGVDNVVIIARNSKTVFTSSSVYGMSEYFHSIYNYQDYPESYWRKYQAPISERMLLPPTRVIDQEETKTVIPMVFTKINNTPISNLVIVNINLSSIITAAEQSMFTENSKIQVINKKSLYAYDTENALGIKINEDFYHAILQDKKTTFNNMIDNKNHLVIAMSPTSSILGYTYAVLIPYSDINKHLWLLLSRTALISLLLSLCALLIVQFSTKKIYNPINRLASLFGSEKNGKKGHNTIEYIQNSILSILNSNSALSNQATASLPLLQERYLIDLLNSGTYRKDETETLPGEQQIKFENNYFCSIVIKLRPTNAFYETYSNMEYQNVQNTIYNMIQAMLKAQFITYIIPSETGMLYALLNPDSLARQSEIDEIFDNIKRIMKNDEKYIVLHIGLGCIYEGVEGLKQSHREAIGAVSSIPMLDQIKINSTSFSELPYQFDIKDENALQNLLISGKITDAKNLIEDIIHKNVAVNISEAAMIQLYTQLLNILFKILRIKKIAYDVNNTGELSMITEIITKPLPEIHNTIMRLLDMLFEHFEGNCNPKVDINEVIDYLDRSYTMDINLDLLSEHFGISSKYMSKLLKEKLGINFVDYLAGLRINKAKELLVTTDKTLTQILEETGFNNRSTFIRTFKKVTGILPSDYRKNSRNEE